MSSVLEEEKRQLEKDKTDALEKILNQSGSLRIIVFYLKRKGYFNNVIGLTTELHMTQIKKYLKPLVVAGIMKELKVGRKGKIYKLNEDNPVTQVFLQLVDYIKEEGH